MSPNSLLIPVKPSNSYFKKTYEFNNILSVSFFFSVKIELQPNPHFQLRCFRCNARSKCPITRKIRKDIPKIYVLVIIS
jgi:hypothetical protein